MIFSSRTILVEARANLRTLIAQNLQVYCDTEITFRNNSDDVNALLKKDKNYQLVVCSAQIGDENTILKIFYYIQSHKLNIPMIGIGKHKEISSSVKIIEDIENWKQIIKVAAKILKINSKEMIHKVVPNYFPISTKNLLNLEMTPCFVYLKLKDTYEPFLDAGDKIDRDFIKKLFLKGIKTIYVEKSWRLSLVNAISKKLSEAFSKAKTAREQIDVLSQAISNTHELIRLTGMTNHSILLAKESISSMKEIAENSEDLHDLLAILEEDTKGFAYKHCLLTNIIAHQTIGNMDWGNKIQQDKVSFMCFFHDITIPEDHLCEIHTEDQLVKANLSPEDKVRVRRHALDAAKLLKGFHQIPFGIDSLILQHHGMINGIGFSQKQTTDLSPIAITFRICEELAQVMLKVGKNFHMDMTMDSLFEKYHKKQYQEVVKSIAKIKV